MVSARECVLGKIHAAAGLDHYLVERVDHRLSLCPHGHVEGVRDAGLRKRHQALAFGTAVLWYAYEHRRSQVAQSLQQTMMRRVPLGDRENALILREAAAPIDVIPVANDIER